MKKEIADYKRIKILFSEYAAFREGIIKEFYKEVLPNAKILLDPMAGTAPLIPFVEIYGLTAYFNDLLPVYYYINRAKTYKVYKSIRSIIEKDSTFLDRELNKCLSPLKNKRLITSEKWIHDDILNHLLSAWQKTKNYKKSIDIFFKAIIVLCVRPFSCVTASRTNAQWYKPGGMTTGRELKQIIKENIEKYLEYYKEYYSTSEQPVRGGNCIFTMKDASELKLKNKVDTIFTSPPYPNRYDYTVMYAPEIYFLSKVNRRSDITYLKKSILATTVVSDYQKSMSDMELISKIAPKTKKFLLDIRNKKTKDADYYFKFYIKYYINFYNILENLIQMLSRKGTLYLVVQNNIHRGELNDMYNFVKNYFTVKGLKANKFYQQTHTHQGRRNISANYPLVLKKHYETIIKVTK